MTISPCPTRLRLMLRYEPQSGKLFWRKRPAWMFPDDRAHTTCQSLASMWNKKFCGKEAFTYLGVHGYLRGSIKPKTFTAHRVAWAIFHGTWPSENIDHINGNRADNRMSNLRDVPNLENCRNQAMSRRNKSGINGVFFAAGFGKWIAQIRDGKRTLHLGSFNGVGEAAAARKEAERQLGYHENHGSR